MQLKSVPFNKQRYLKSFYKKGILDKWCLINLIFTIWLSMIFIAPGITSAYSLRPANLLMFYGDIESIYNDTNIDELTGRLNYYDYAIISHIPGDPNTLTKFTKTAFFGYVDMAEKDALQNPNIDLIQTRISQWKSANINGIYFDNFGEDFSLDSNAVAFTHDPNGINIPIIIDSTRLTELPNDPNYPFEEGIALNMWDYMLFKDHQIKGGEYIASGEWIEKAQRLQQYQISKECRILSCATFPNDLYNDNNTLDDTNLKRFLYSWFSALMFGHTATGWSTEDYFSNSTEIPPLPQIPSIDPGSYFTTDIINNDPLYYRETNLMRIYVNTNPNTHAYGVIPLRGDGDVRVCFIGSII